MSVRLSPAHSRETPPAASPAPKPTFPAPKFSARRRGGGVTRQRSSILLTVLMGLMALYALLPLFWLLVNSTKTQTSLFSSFGLWFSGDFALWDNVVGTLTYNDGEFLRWLANTVLYVVVGAGGATFLATLAGYGLAKFDFPPGKRGVFAVVLGAVAIPGTALAVPTFLMFSQMGGLTNTPWSVIIPSLISPFGSTWCGSTPLSPSPRKFWKQRAWTGGQGGSSVRSSPSH